jgi:DNA-binding transcriptional LysR family regulator
VRDGSFSRAARTFNIAQPTISARIQGLEQVVGGPLFRRGGRSIVLTELGESFLLRALVADELATGRLVEIAVEDFPTCYRESALVCLKTGTMGAALRDFVAMLREEAGELVVKYMGS